jgi:hypothetical protein
VGVSCCFRLYADGLRRSRSLGNEFGKDPVCYCTEGYWGKHAYCGPLWTMRAEGLLRLIDHAVQID